MNTENMKKIIIGNKTEKEWKEHKCSICGNTNCTGYKPVNVALDSTAYIETCDDFFHKNASREVPQFIIDLRDK